MTLFQHRALVLLVDSQLLEAERT